MVIRKGRSAACVAPPRVAAPRSAADAPQPM